MVEGGSTIGAAKPPAIRRLLRELLDIPAVITAPLRRPLVSQRCGNGEAVLIIPGFLSDDNATSLLRRSFDAAGFRAFGWRNGFNTGVTLDLLDRLNARLEAVSGEKGGPVILVGWSLGGLYARALANHRPDLVSMVITMGSPFSGSLRANHAWRLYQWINGHAVDNLPIPVDFRTKPPVPTIAFWSPRDGVVAPACSRGEPGESDERMEYPGTHMGFCVSERGVKAVVNLLLDRVAASPVRPD